MKSTEGDEVFNNGGDQNNYEKDEFEKEDGEKEEKTSVLGRSIKHQ